MLVLSFIYAVKAVSYKKTYYITFSFMWTLNFVFTLNFVWMVPITTNYFNANLFLTKNLNILLTSF